MLDEFALMLYEISEKLTLAVDGYELVGHRREVYATAARSHDETQTRPFPDQKKSLVRWRF
jgi:hypothetical protein